MTPCLWLVAAHAGEDLPDRLAARASTPDVVLIPPVGEPSPRAGSFLIPYAPSGEPDPTRVGTYDVGPSSCSEVLRFKSVPATEVRSELWLVDSGVGATLGLPRFGVSASFGHKALAGLDYTVTDKLVVDGGLRELEECCLRSPERCTDRYVSEVWRGPGKLYRMQGDEATLKTSLKALDKVGKLDFGTTRGWSAASEWPDEMYFAYRTSAFQAPSCQSYMNDLAETEGKVLFTGVSKKSLSEQDARRDARTDAREQLARYLGEQFSVRGDEVTTSAEALVSGVKDTLTCLDPVEQGPEGPMYLARVRMYVDQAAIQGAVQQARSTTGR